MGYQQRIAGLEEENRYLKMRLFEKASIPRGVSLEDGSMILDDTTVSSSVINILSISVITTLMCQGVLEDVISSPTSLPQLKHSPRDTLVNVQV